MANKGRALTATDVAALQDLYGVLSAFLKEMKLKAQLEDKKGALAARKYFEKYIVQASDDLAIIEARIRRAEKALYRKETRALQEELEKAEENSETTE